MSALDTRLIGTSPALAIDLMGGGDSVPLVMLHGIGGNRTNWHDDMAVLARQRLVIAIDARGYGGSEDYDGDVTMQQMGGDVLRVLDALDIDRAVLVGLSLGASIALEVAALAPDRVAGLGLVAAAPMLAQSLSESQRRDFIASRQAPLMNGASLTDIAPSVAASLLGPGAHADVRARLEASIAALHRDSYLKTIAASFSYVPTRPLHAITCPTLVLHGTADPLVPVEVAEETAAAIAGARLHRLDGIGHLVNFEAPEAFRAVLVEFLATIDSADPASDRAAAQPQGDPNHVA